MKSSNILRIFLILLLVALNIGCDQVSKSLVRERVNYHEQIELIGEHFILTKVENTGAFLSFGSSFPPILRDIILIYLPVLAMLFILGMILTRHQLRTGVVTGICFMVGGGIGNLIDRIAYGSVTDFLHIDLNVVRTGVFNMADVSIMLGGIMILLFFKTPKKTAETPPMQTSPDSPDHS